MPLHKKLLLPFCIVSLFFASAAIPFTLAETFRNPRRIPLTVDPYGVTTGDLNGDGRNDIVWTELSGYPATPALHVLLAGANGQYTAAPDLSLPFYPTFLQCILEDVTGDKHNDLVCVGPSDDYTNVYLLTWPGRGDGTFSSPIQTSVTAQPLVSNPILARAGDLNGDGLPDILVMNGYYSGILPYFSDGQGGFKAGASFQGSFNFSVPTVTDLNGDGKLDVLWPTGPRVDLGNGDGTFSAITQYDPGYLSYCAFGDVDGDGHLDAACTWIDDLDINGYIHLTVLHGNADGSFSKTPLFTRTFGNGENEYDGFATISSPVLVTDLNGDGYADIVSISGDGYCVLLGGPNTTWNGQPRQFVAASSKSVSGIFGIYGVSFADMNGDRLPDIVAVGTNGLYITYAKADGTLSSAPAVELGQVSTGVTLVDVNGDGNLDAVSAGDTALKLSLGNGDGTFNPPQPITTVDNFGDANYIAPKIVSGDFNGDGKQDLLATGSIAAYTSQSYILFGHGDGIFDTPAPISISLGKVADLNNDGRSDVYSIQNNATALNVLVASLSLGDGTFTTVSTNVPAETVSNEFVAASSGPALADFRHSGRLDAAVASFNNVYVLRSHGDGTFDTTGTMLAIPGLPNLDKIGSNDVAAGDFDGDGKPDVAVLVQYGSGEYDQSTPTSAVWVYYGNGDGTFSAATPAGTFNRDAQTLSAGDLNGDGLADLVLTSSDVYQDNGVLIVHALPHRAWGVEVDYTGGDGLSPSWITDINHDGRNDLIFANGGNSISVLLNQAASTVDGALTASPEPSNVTYPFALNASLAPSNASDTLSGNVTFTLDGTVAGTVALSGNAASLSLPGITVAAGKHSLSAAWAGDATHPAVTLNGDHTVSLLPLSLGLAATPVSLSPGGTVTATATFTPGVMPNLSTYQFTGTMTLNDNGVAIAQQPVSPNGFSFALPSLTIGTHALSVSYPGDALFAAAQSNTVTVTVAGAATSAVLTATPATSSYGTPVTLTATVNSTSPGTITGTVAFYANGILLSSGTVANGAATVIPTTALRSGTYSLTCAYSGDTTFAASTCAPVSITVKNASTALTLVPSANPVPALSSVTFTANLTAQGKPLSGAILFSVDGVSFKSPVATDTNGNASYPTTLPAGRHTVGAQFAGMDSYDASSASVVEMVAPNPTTTSLTQPAGAVYQNQAFTLLAVVNATTGTAAPYGTVTLSEGGVVLAQAVEPLSASASGSTATTFRLAVASLAAGAHSMIAAYAPLDGNFLPSTSQAISVVVIPQSFTLSISSPTLSIPVEHYKSFSASVQSLGTFQGPVQLTCAVPQNVYLTCDIASPVLQLAANGSATSEFTMDTDALLRFKSALGSGPRPGQTTFGSAAIALGLLFPLHLGFLVRRRRGRILSVMLLLVALGATLSVTGCGNKYPAHTPPGAYDVVITATGTSIGSTAAVTQTVPMQLTVTPE